MRRTKGSRDPLPTLPKFALSGPSVKLRRPKNRRTDCYPFIMWLRPPSPRHMIRAAYLCSARNPIFPSLYYTFMLITRSSPPPPLRRQTMRLQGGPCNRFVDVSYTHRVNVNVVNDWHLFFLFFSLYTFDMCV